VSSFDGGRERHDVAATERGEEGITCSPFLAEEDIGTFTYASGSKAASVIAAADGRDIESLAAGKTLPEGLLAIFPGELSLETTRKS
jgi:hypothetical protein